MGADRPLFDFIVSRKVTPRPRPHVKVILVKVILRETRDHVLAGWAIAIVTVMLIGAGCASSPDRAEKSASAAFEQPCIPPPNPRGTVPVAGLHYGQQTRQGDGYLSRVDDSVSEDLLSPQAVRTARLLGVHHLIWQVIGPPLVVTASAQETDIRELKAHQQLSDRLLLASLDTANVASEIDCEVARTDRRADVLESEEAQRHRKLIVLAILGDAAVGVVSGMFGLVELITAEAIASIAGGSVSTTAGMTATLGKPKETGLEHPRNPLREVWQPPQNPAIFPSVVWRHLNWPLGNDPSKRTRRDMLITEWKQEGWLGEPGSTIERKRLDLFFGDGGPYTVDDLRTRARMLQVLKTHINLLNQDIDLLLREILVGSVRTKTSPLQLMPGMLQTSTVEGESGGKAP